MKHKYKIVIEFEADEDLSPKTLEELEVVCSAQVEFLSEGDLGSLKGHCISHTEPVSASQKLR